MKGNEKKSHLKVRKPFGPELVVEFCKRLNSIPISFIITLTLLYYLL